MQQPTPKNAGFKLFDNPKQLLTIKQVAEAFGVKDDTVRKWVYSRDLFALRIKDGQLRIRASDAEALLTPAMPEAGTMPNC